MTTMNWNAKTALLNPPPRRGILNTLRMNLRPTPATTSAAKHRSGPNRPSYSTIAIRNNTVPAIFTRGKR